VPPVEYEIEGDKINKLTLYKTVAEALAAGGQTG
jgi:hypothetical protein